MLTAATGATLRELMDRMGHSTARAALIYQHGSHARQHEIADALGQLARQQMTDSPAPNKVKRSKPTGTGRARAWPASLMKIAITYVRKALTWDFCWRPEQDSNLRPTA